jgi:hypothetical protein
MSGSESGSEDFLARWLRLKSETERALPAADVSAAPAFDPTSLPAIESIVADSDIRQFLQAQVPEELTRAALRSAWTADPAIRDFVGIAENQWDFNDHAAMAGFGPLDAASYLVAQALESLSPSGQGTPESSALEQAALPSNEPPCIAPVEEPRQVAETTGVEASLGPPVPLSGKPPCIEPVEDPRPVPETSDAGPGPPGPRSHGGALPK